MIKINKTDVSPSRYLFLNFLKTSYAYSLKSYIYSSSCRSPFGGYMQKCDKPESFSTTRHDSQEPPRANAFMVTDDCVSVTLFYFKLNDTQYKIYPCDYLCRY